MFVPTTYETVNNDAVKQEKHSSENDGVFTGLFRDCVYGICLKLKQHVLATHRELSILRRCADMLRDPSPRIIHVVAKANQQKTNFIVNTLLHLGVSCGQIKVSAVGVPSDGAQDVWLFVTDS
ncbi:hypothetical protein [Kaarinaea lacus]